MINQQPLFPRARIPVRSRLDHVPCRPSRRALPRPGDPARPAAYRERRRRKIDRYERLFQEVVPNALVERGASGEYEAPSLRGIETELTSRVADPDEEDIFGGPPKSPQMLGEAARQTIALDATRERDKATGGAEMI